MEVMGIAVKTFLVAGMQAIELAISIASFVSTSAAERLLSYRAANWQPLSGQILFRFEYRRFASSSRGNKVLSVT
jgi:hypothetical protein